MPLLYTLLLIAFGFAGIMLVLLSITLVYYECCKSRRNSEDDDYPPNDREVPLLHNNNNSLYEPDATPTTYSFQTVPITSGQLTSRASAPVLTDLPQTQAPRRIRTITSGSSTYSIDTPISPEEMRAVQAGILRNEKERLDYNLIIGVCATSIDFCGYCVNLQEQWVEFYKIQAEHLPWQLLDQPDNSEMEMRNFFFALMLWSETIEESKKFDIYTGSHAIEYDNNRLWRKASKLLEHFQACQKIIVGNECRYYVNARKEVKSFAVKILPAEDLSVNNFNGFQDFISQYYGIPLTNFRGSHNLTVPVGEVTENYQLYIDKVRDARLKWTSPCDECAYIDEDAGAASS